MKLYNLLIISAIVILFTLPTMVGNYSGEYESGDIENISIVKQTNINAQSDSPRVIYNGDGDGIGSWAFGHSDNVVPRDGGRYGHIVHLNTPDGNQFIIGKIGINAQRYGVDGYTRFEIWDDNCILYSNVIRHSEYSSLEWSGWTYIDMPNVIVYDDFYINICTGSTRDNNGVYVAFDTDTGVCGSYRSYNTELYWDLDDHARCDVNWMICAVEATDGSTYDDGYTDGHTAGIAEAILNEIIGDVTGDGKVNICDAVLLFNWVSYQNERGTTYILR